MSSNQLSKTPLNNNESCNSVFEANKNDTQLKYQQILEEHRWITNLIWNKIHALIVVNGILFSAFNILLITNSNSEFFVQKASLSIVGLLISIFWFFILDHSIIYKENYRNQIFQIQDQFPEISINFIDDHDSWGGIFGTNIVAKISTIGLSILWVVLLCGLKIGIL